MRHFIYFTMVFMILMVMIPALAFAGEIKKDKNGMCQEVYKSSKSININYQVDTISELCYAIIRVDKGVGVTEISCEKLAKRPEWKPIITWHKKDEPTKPLQRDSVGESDE